MSEPAEQALRHVNPYSTPSALRITDMRFTDVVGTPGRCTLLKIYTNQGLVGLGEVRDGASRTYALMLKGRILGENPCNVDKLFRRIKQFGGHGRQGGGVSGVEVALWDLAGKAYGMPVYQMLGGKFRDRVRMYVDTDAGGKPDGKTMGEALKRRMEMGFTFLKMDLGMWQLSGQPGTLSAPLGFLEELRNPGGGRRAGAAKRATKSTSGSDGLERHLARNRAYDVHNIAHPFTGIQLTEKGLDALERYTADVRSVIGDEVPLAIDHMGHINVESIMRLAGILETKKIGDLAQEYGVAMAIHMAERGYSLDSSNPNM